MPYGWLADSVLVAHLAFVAFVVFGGLWVLGRPSLAWAHAPAVLWGVLTEYANLVCPLTPLEVALRQRAGEAGYAGSFIEHHIVAWLYPADLTRGLQVSLGTLVLAINVVLYWRLAVVHRSGRTKGRVRRGGAA